MGEHMCYHGLGTRVHVHGVSTCVITVWARGFMYIGEHMCYHGLGTRARVHG